MVILLIPPFLTAPVPAAVNGSQTGEQSARHNHYPLTRASLVNKETGVVPLTSFVNKETSFVTI